MTLDFGNTLVPVERGTLSEVVARTADRVVEELGLPDAPAFVATWREERDRQFREEVPLFREVDLSQRAARVLARLRGQSPGPDEPWDDGRAAARSTPAEVGTIVATYSDEFVASVRPPAASRELIAALAGRRFQVAILSNWPLASTIDRVADAAGWSPFLSGIFVSQRIGTIKPHPAIFDHVEERLGRRSGEIIHVGDDWVADVGGAMAAGWHAAYLCNRQRNTSLPTSVRDATVVPDLELDDLADLPGQLADPPPVHSRDGGT